MFQYSYFHEKRKIENFTLRHVFSFPGPYAAVFNPQYRRIHTLSLLHDDDNACLSLRFLYPTATSAMAVTLLRVPRRRLLSGSSLRSLSHGPLPRGHGSTRTNLTFFFCHSVKSFIFWSPSQSQQSLNKSLCPLSLPCVVWVTSVYRDGHWDLSYTVYVDVEFRVTFHQNLNMPDWVFSRGHKMVRLLGVFTLNALRVAMKRNFSCWPGKHFACLCSSSGDLRRLYTGLYW